MKWIKKCLGLKGSWKWAKKQMLAGKIVRCRHWSGDLKLRVRGEVDTETGAKSTLLEANYTKRNTMKWNPCYHHLVYEEYTDYEVFNWKYNKQKR